MIQIRLDDRNPPAGQVDSRPFVGWLQLLSILADLIGGPDEPDPLSPPADAGPGAPAGS